MSEFSEKYGPWALITGGSDGIGLAFANRLADEGINLVLVGRNVGKLDAASKEITAKGVECVTASVDIGADGACDKIVAAIGEREVGLFVANAGADPNGSRFLDKDISAWDNLVTMNVNSKMHLCHHLGRQMRDRGRGGMILVSSGACYSGMFGLAAYCASKGFVLNFAEALWAEFRHHNVDVLTMVLGQTDTPSYRKILAESGQSIPENWADPENVAETALRQLPHGPIWNWGQTNDVAGMAPNSPDERRAKIEYIEQMSAAPLVEG
ncbi:MAG: SDR family NAD(P)-dependent oxidoreductase [Novosphingobium sp.]|nr:SDR family NAD(P)-dependent oxidoreductase [Novosphingobium sp.]